MSQRNDYSRHAELALVAYANFMSGKLTQAELRDADFSTSQAQPSILQKLITWSLNTLKLKV